MQITIFGRSKISSAMYSLRTSVGQKISKFRGYFEKVSTGKQDTIRQSQDALKTSDLLTTNSALMMGNLPTPTSGLRWMNLPLQVSQVGSTTRRNDRVPLKGKLYVDIPTIMQAT